MQLLEHEKIYLTRILPSHADHEVLSVDYSGITLIIYCSCGAKLELPVQPYQVAVHMKTGYVQHGYLCRFSRHCVCDR